MSKGHLPHADDQVTIFGHTMPKANIIKLGGLLLFFAVIVGVGVAIWPMVGDLFSEGGVDKVVTRIQDAGPYGVFVLLLMQLLQVIVAFIPGELVQMAAGILYGPWWGAAIILIGCLISSAIIYELVHRLGAPFVEAMVPTKYLGKIHAFEESGKLNIVVFILFFIPGMPKDVFTYLVPLTEMPMRPYLLITTLARIPGVFLSTYAAAGLFDGNIWGAVAIFAAVGVIALLVYIFREKLMNMGTRKN